MTATLQEWDARIAPILRRLEDEMRSIRGRLIFLNLLVERLPMRPEWFSKAEHELEETLKKLDEHRLLVDAAKSELLALKKSYLERPIE